MWIFDVEMVCLVLEIIIYVCIKMIVLNEYLNMRNIIY